jgi:hypothetical protein
MIPNIRNLILTVRIRKHLARNTEGRQNAAGSRQAGKARVLEAVPLACGFVAPEWDRTSLVGEVGHAFAGAIDARVAGFDVAAGLDVAGLRSGLEGRGVHHDSGLKDEADECLEMHCGLFVLVGGEFDEK